MPLFRSFRSRMVFYFLGVVSLVQIAVFISVDATNERLAREQVGMMLDDGVLGVRRAIESRTGQMTATMRTLAGDAAFREAVSRRDQGPLSALLRGYGIRAGADMLLVGEPDGRLVADASTRQGANFLLGTVQKLVPKGESTPFSGPVTVDDQAYQVIVLPMPGERGTTWLVAGFSLDNRFAEDVLQVTRMETSFAVREAGRARRVVASSLPAMRRAALGVAVSRINTRPSDTISVDLYGDEFLGRIVPLGRDGAGGVEVVVQRSLAKELESFDDLRAVVMFLSIGGLVLSAFGALFVARSVTEPANALTEAARGVAKGDFNQPIEVDRKDELGTLAKAFDGMVKGLAERDRVRNVLGKVVSPEVAGMILTRGVELGGEEKLVTVLCSDLRGFKVLGGAYSPRETVDLLNAYLSRMTAVIEAHHGVVDKYLGAGIMAIFGAPVSHGDDAGNALAAALAMQANLEDLNDELARNNLPALDMGIGVNTSLVLAGNLGSPARLAYTVMGDGVALAARLEGLSARGGVDARVLASAETMRRTKRVFSVRPLAAASVLGKSDPELIYAVLGEPAGEAGRSAEAAVPA